MASLRYIFLDLSSLRPCFCCPSRLSEVVRPSDQRSDPAGRLPSSAHVTSPTPSLKLPAASLQPPPARKTVQYRYIRVRGGHDRRRRAGRVRHTMLGSPAVLGFRQAMGGRPSTVQGCRGRLEAGYVLCCRRRAPAGAEIEPRGLPGRVIADRRAREFCHGQQALVSTQDEGKRGQTRSHHGRHRPRPGRTVISRPPGLRLACLVADLTCFLAGHANGQSWSRGALHLWLGMQQVRRASFLRGHLVLTLLATFISVLTTGSNDLGPDLASVEPQYSSQDFTSAHESPLVLQRLPLHHRSEPGPAPLPSSTAS